MGYMRTENISSKCTKLGTKAGWSPKPTCEPSKCKVPLLPLEGTTYELTRNGSGLQNVQRNHVKNLTSAMHTLPAMRRKLTNTMNESTIHAGMIVKDILLLSVTEVIGLGFRAVQSVH
ncbi:complement factor H-like isoform X1 [Lates japonicus]|uniref:Complement factor H-like isoform X1 n=1 Tax=Lates japonicus TaxID=270547 RepID=A0AAD3MEU1_LATJO|nr:complement factor H-like isoform X1 [Lates japonicus]